MLSSLIDIAKTEKIDSQDVSLIISSMLETAGKQITENIGVLAGYRFYLFAGLPDIKVSKILFSKCIISKKIKT